jgi:hypothetical protein
MLQTTFFNALYILGTLVVVLAIVGVVDAIVEAILGSDDD